MCTCACVLCIPVPRIVYGIWCSHGQAVSLQRPGHLMEDSEGKRAWWSLIPLANFRKVWWASWKSIAFGQEPQDSEHRWEVSFEGQSVSCLASFWSTVRCRGTM